MYGQPFFLEMDSSIFPSTNEIPYLYAMATMDDLKEGGIEILTRAIKFMQKFPEESKDRKALEECFVYSVVQGCRNMLFVQNQKNYPGPHAREVAEYVVAACEYLLGEDLAPEEVREDLADAAKYAFKMVNGVAPLRQGDLKYLTNICDILTLLDLKPEEICYDFDESVAWCFDKNLGRVDEMLAQTDTKSAEKTLKEIDNAYDLYIRLAPGKGFDFDGFELRYANLKNMATA